MLFLLPIGLYFIAELSPQAAIALTLLLLAHLYRQRKSPQ